MRVLLTGAGGMVGQSFARQWRASFDDSDLSVLTRSDVDLRDRAATAKFVAERKADLVIHAAAKVGGIADKLAHPATFLLDNLQLDSSVVEAAVTAQVPRLIYVSSAVIYPAVVDQPISEDALFNGAPEKANEPYALAKLATTRLMAFVSAQYGYRYTSVVPSNLYGPGEDFSVEGAHLVASALRKVHEAKEASTLEVEVWGDGTARREFTFVDDLTSWLAGVAASVEDLPDRLNVGYGSDHSIREYYEVASDVVGHDCELVFDETQPSGVPQRLLDSSLARTHGWNPTTNISDGMARSYAAFLDRHTKDA